MEAGKVEPENAAEAWVECAARSHWGGLALIGLTGPAGVGKTTMAERLAQRLNLVHYQIDWRFQLDSKERQDLFKAKQSTSIDSLLDACNQMNWWDWDQVTADLRALHYGDPVDLGTVYDRRTGQRKEGDIIIPAGKRGVLVDGAVLGPIQMRYLYTGAVLLWEPAIVRLQRLFSKDKDRRTDVDTAARWLITEWSERSHYRELVYKSDPALPMMCGNSEGWLRPFPSEEELSPATNYLPLQLTPTTP